LQRRLQIGYPRAARLKELLDEEFEKENKQTSEPHPLNPMPRDDTEEEPPEEGKE
jgi:DNA segregation ATPase FtsK/SpoIIIE-like protein